MNKVGYPSSPHLQRGEYLRPLTEEESESLKSKFQDFMVAEFLPTLNENLRGLAEARRGIAAADTKIAAGQAKIAAGQAKIAVGQAKIAVGQAMQDSGLTKMFYTIFKGKADPAAKDLPAQEINRLFRTYLADGSISSKTTSGGLAYPCINSMNPITTYLDNHPKVSMCNFTAFKAEVHDVPTLAEYLKYSNIKAIAFRSSISEEAKASLAEAVAARKGSLKVQYLA